MSLLVEFLLIFSLILGAYFSFLAIKSRDLVKAIVFSAGQSSAFALAFFLLMAPDVVLAYLAVAVGIYTIVLLYAVKKTERFEEDE
ncbi:MAG: DUF4040 domain-containing protein [Candidatus Nezhaarchaeota archaeon]|nr:DUF4040 domain-containing protein [Candidatus Nezhaarchaeota archaeon]